MELYCNYRYLEVVSLCVAVDGVVVHQLQHKMIILLPVPRKGHLSPFLPVHRGHFQKALYSLLNTKI